MYVELSDGKINFTGMFVLGLAQHRDALVGLRERRPLKSVTVRVRERATVLSGRKLTAHHHIRNVYRPTWGPRRFRSYSCPKKKRLSRASISMVPASRIAATAPRLKT